MKYQVHNAITGNICGPNSRCGRFRDYSNFGKFETVDINVAYLYKTVMEEENPRSTYKVVEIG